MRVYWTKYRYSKLATFISFFGGVMEGAGILTVFGAIAIAMEGEAIAAGVTGVVGILGIVGKSGLDALAERVSKKKVERILRNKLNSMAARAKEDGLIERQP